MRGLISALLVVGLVLGSVSCAGEPELPPEPSPEVVGQWESEGVICGYAAGELDGRSYLFLKTMQGGLPAAATLRVLDVSDPTAPVEAGSLEVSGATVMPPAGA